MSADNGNKGHEMAGGPILPSLVESSLVELCEAGLLTCTRGSPGEDGATYALAWLPLDNPEQYSNEVRERHNANMAAFGQLGDWHSDPYEH